MCVCIFPFFPIDLPELVFYFQSCYKYRNSSHCIEFTTQLLESKEPRLDQRTINEAKLLKGKSMYYEYQGEQQLYISKFEVLLLQKLLNHLNHNFTKKQKNVSSYLEVPMTMAY